MRCLHAATNHRGRTVVWQAVPAFGPEHSGSRPPQCQQPIREGEQEAGQGGGGEEVNRNEQRIAGTAT
jgi:hypothetical protein